MILSFITNDPIMATYVQAAGIDRIMIDLEVKDKNIRQSGRNLFLSDHSIIDIPTIKKKLKKNSLFVRINPINNNSKKEVDTVIRLGADIVMLPFFHSMDEVKTFLKLTDGTVKNSLLIETKEAAELLPQIVDLKGVHEIHIGFNDLSISFGYKTIFEPILNGSLQEYATIVNNKKIPWGFGGIAKLSDTTLPVNPELILCEQLRLKSSVGWLGRSFRDSLDRKNISLSLQKEVSIIRNFLRDYTQAPKDFFDLKHIELLEQIHLMKNQMK
ncbi:aldolase/citrate lyase family protein [Peribacillus sp. ACCC06369]|uniref:aldolase/citrate lyase family protein n=1 Tax=Peribacillus sp. ACCC06369 TaxID=3055860 RepID=UPI0025A190A0|nr:aldolase/citrate lyase family protein [Peribacillus sp. ACCC06369]MDM5356376.1 aldolase/citrate lyase family protein [Peribacillus sp. ACCC06369]